MCLNPLESGQCFLQFTFSIPAPVTEVSIPSNRVNASYRETTSLSERMVKSQSPRIGSMLPTYNNNAWGHCDVLSQSPRIGSMLPTTQFDTRADWIKGLNPLESGQCFLHHDGSRDRTARYRLNPLESGQCFLRWWRWTGPDHIHCLNPLESGQCFLQD